VLWLGLGLGPCVMVRVRAMFYCKGHVLWLGLGLGPCVMVMVRAMSYG
jgi:hypothetical protein